MRMGRHDSHPAVRDVNERMGNVHYHLEMANMRLQSLRGQLDRVEELREHTNMTSQEYMNRLTPLQHQFNRVNAQKEDLVDSLNQLKQEKREIIRSLP
jgi:chromosome segregation ATPase